MFGLRICWIIGGSISRIFAPATGDVEAELEAVFNHSEEEFAAIG
ncbi:MAG: hypothetical protein WKF84_17210 [Pyrinomonadaceae bacterium]